MRAEIRQGDRSSSSEMGKRTWAQEKNHLERKGPPSKFAKGEGGLRNEMDKAHSFEQTVHRPEEEFSPPASAEGPPVPGGSGQVSREAISRVSRSGIKRTAAPTEGRDLQPVSLQRSSECQSRPVPSPPCQTWFFSNLDKPPGHSRPQRRAILSLGV